MARLQELAKVIRSKNAKPFYLTLDVLFDDQQKYERVARSEALTAESMGKLYQMEPKRIRVIPYPAARAIKVTLERWVPAGSFYDRDLLGAQQAVLLFDVEVP